MSVFFFFSFFLVFFLVFFIFLLSYSYMDSDFIKSNSFECGFYSFNSISYPFSVPFFLISLLFLLFDVEILLVFLYPIGANFFYYLSEITYLILFSIIFLTLYEWLKGIISWF